MNAQEIRNAVDAGKSVHWACDSYSVIKTSDGTYQIRCAFNAYQGELGGEAGRPLNGREEDFYVST